MNQRTHALLGALVVAATGMSASAEEATQAPALGLLGAPPLQAQRLSEARGGADVLNDMKLKGVVTDNQAVNVTTGSNLISDGALAGSAGMPMVIQNSGNNVLIQNATIVNVQLK